MAQAKNTLLAALAALTLGASANAGPDQVSILLASHHVGATKQYEEFNPGVFLTWTEAIVGNNLDVGVAAFRNSYGDGSLAVTTGLPLARKENWGIDLFGAIAWYPDNGHQFSHSVDDVVPIIGLQGRYRNLFMLAIPSGGQSVDATLAFGLTFSLNGKSGD